MASVTETIPTYKTLADVPVDVVDCWIDGVLYHRCGAGRRYHTKTAIPPCGELKPHTAPHYHRNKEMPANIAGERVMTTCAGCVNRNKHRKNARYTTETPRDRAVVVFTSTPQAQTKLGAIRLGIAANGDHWFPVRPMLALTRFEDESGLYRAIEGDPLLGATVAYTLQLAEDGKQREMLHLPSRYATRLGFPRRLRQRPAS